MLRRSRHRGYEIEHQRLLEKAATLDPTGTQYKDVMARIDQLDQIMNRSTEGFKTVATASLTVAGAACIYAVQQFGGVVVPKIMDTWHARRNSSKDEQS